MINEYKTLQELRKDLGISQTEEASSHDNINK